MGGVGSQESHRGRPLLPYYFEPLVYRTDSLRIEQETVLAETAALGKERSPIGDVLFRVREAQIGNRLLHGLEVRKESSDSCEPCGEGIFHVHAKAAVRLAIPNRA